MFPVKLYRILKAKNAVKNILFKIKIIIFSNGIILGKENKVLFTKCSKYKNRINILGHNNLISIKNSEILNCSFKITGNNCKILVDKNCHLNDVDFHLEGNNVQIIISENCFIGKSHLAAVEQNSKIFIGKKCMISSNVYLRTSDSHPIYNLNTSKRINLPKSIHISEKVWIGEGVKILKGVNLKSNTVVSSGSIITKSFDESNVVIGGIPAKVIKKEIFWKRER